MSNYPKVLFVIPGIKKGNKCTFSIGQAEALIRFGIGVNIFFLESRTNPFKILASVVEIIREVNRAECGLIHAHFGTVTALLSAIVSTITRVPLLVTYHGSDLNNTSSADGYTRDFFQRLFSNLAALKAARIICVSEQVKSGLWWRKSIASVIPCGIDLEVFHPMEKDSCREHLGWEPSAKIVAFNNGSGSPIKRQELVEKVIENIRSVFPSVKLRILKDLECSQVPIYLNASDCLVLCSDNEGSPTIIKEALACNLPIVSVPVGDVPEMLRKVYPSALAKQDLNALSAAVTKILQQDIRSNGREVSASKFDNKTVTQQVATIYSAIHDQDGAPSAISVAYQIYQHESADIAPVKLPSPYSFFLWRPGATNLIPPGLDAKFLFWFFFHFLRVFRNRDYAVLYVKEGESIVHRSCVVPAYFRWPFMAPGDLQISSTWTDPVCRGKGLATAALMEILRLMRAPGRKFVYVTRPDNPASIDVCLKAGFKLFSKAERVNLYGFRVLGKLVATPKPNDR